MNWYTVNPTSPPHPQGGRPGREVARNRRNMGWRTFEEVGIAWDDDDGHRVGFGWFAPRDLTEVRAPRVPLDRFDLTENHRTVGSHPNGGRS